MTPSSSDNLPYSAELNLGFDESKMDPYQVDTDGDALSDNEYATKGTSPLLADTDRDGVRDDVDRAPLGDAFVTVRVVGATAFGSDDDGTSALELFLSVQVGNQTAYTAHPSVAPGGSVAFDHDYSVNVPDDQNSVSITIRAWDHDPDDVHDAFEVSRFFSGGVWQGDVVWTFSHLLIASGPQTYTSSGLGSMRLDPITVTVTTASPSRIQSYVLLPDTYDGVYNVTNAAGATVSRRYVGETRFVALLLNVTGSVSFDPVAILVPRSVFFDTRLYAYLNDSNPVDPVDRLTFRQNLTSAASNSDELQHVLSGNVTTADVQAILDLLTRNGTNVVVHATLALTNDLFLYSLPDGAVRLVGYDPPPTAFSPTYTFAGGPTTAKPWWERIWEGLLIVVAVVVSAIVLPITGFAALVRLFVQVGAWVADLLSGDPVRVERAVKAAQKAFDQMVDGIAKAMLAIWDSIVKPLIRPIVDAYMAWANEFAQHIMSMRKQSLNDFVRGLIQFMFYSGFALAIFAIIVAFSVAEKITNAMTLGLANLAGIVIGIIAGVIIGMLLVAAINEWLGSTVIEDLLPSAFDEVTGATFTVAQLLFAYELAQRPLKPIRGIETALHDAIIGLMILGAATVIEQALGDTVLSLTFLVLLDAFALYKELSGVSDVIHISGRGANLVRGAYPFLYPVTVAMNAIGMATAATDLAGDAGKLTRKLQGQ